MQLNHEFLADQEIVEEYNNVPFYQKLLLEKGSGIETIYLASNLNYLVTKKRLIMMTKKTSKNIAFLKKVAIVPVLMALTALLCIKTVAQETKMKTDTLKNNSDNKRSYSKTSVVADQKKNDVLTKENDVLTEEQKRNVSPPRSAASSSVISTDIIVDHITKKPEFPGGMPEFYKFIGENFKLPAEASKNKIQGKLFVEFMVEKDGSLSEFKIIKDLGYGIGDEVIRALQLSPAWTPGSESGKPVRVLYSLPITIENNEEPKKYKVINASYPRMDFAPTIFGN